MIFFTSSCLTTSRSVKYTKEIPSMSPSISGAVFSPDTASLGMDRGLISALKKHGVRIVTSSDAHTPEDVGWMIRELRQCVESAE